jgi:hypothetical protein
MSKSNRSFVYFAVITLTEKRSVRCRTCPPTKCSGGTALSSKREDRLAKTRGFYAHGEVIAAAKNDAQALEDELDEKNIMVHYIRTREDAPGRPY